MWLDIGLYIHTHTHIYIYIHIYSFLLVMEISAKGEFFGWLGCWINDKQIMFSYAWLIDDWRMSNLKKKKRKKERRG